MLRTYVAGLAGCLLLLSASCTQLEASPEATGTAESAFTGSVSWTDVVGVNAVGNNLTKTGSVGFNAGAASNETLPGDGYVQFSTGEANTDKFVGLSNTDTGHAYADIDFAFYLTSNGQALIYEDGTYLARGGSYSAGDVLEIQTLGSVVTYLVNGNWVYTSSKTPTLPLLVNTSLYTPGATVQNVQLADIATAPVWQNEVGVNAVGNSLTKTGAVAGFNAGAYTTAAISISRGYAEFTTGEANTDKMAGLSHSVTDSGYADIDYAFYLTGAGDALIYEAGTYRATAGAYVSGDVFRVQTTDGVVTYLQNGTVVYTSLVTPTLPLVLDVSLYTTGATIQNATVTETPYWQNQIGVSVAAQSLTKTGPAGWNAGASTTANFTGDGYAEFTTGEANTDKMAGLSHGDTSTNFAEINFAVYLTGDGHALVYEDGAYLATIGTYVAGDVFRVQSVGGVVTYLQNGNLAYTSSGTPVAPLLLDTSLYTTGATINNVTIAAITAPSYWQYQSGVSASGEDLTKTGSPGWNAGASTSATLSGDGWAEFTTGEANTDKMAGLSHTDESKSKSFANIDYAFYLTSDGKVLIYEDGVYRFSAGSYVASDVFRVQTASGVVTYLQNGNVVWTSSVAPTPPLLIDASLYTTGATIQNATLTAGP